MVSISSVGSKVIGSATKSRPVKALCNYFNKDFEKALAYTTIGSIIAKDGIGCGMYVYQSMHNKDIPEKRRNFVASLDLTNGILMILAQIGMFFAMKKVNDSLFPKLFKKSFDKEGKIIKTITEQVRINQRKLGIKPTKKFIIKKEYEKIKKNCFDTFKFVTELAAATIIGKRVVVPFIATPLAQKVEKKMNEKHAAEEASTNGDNTSSKAEPTMKETAQKINEDSSIQQSKNENGSTNLLQKYKQ